MRDMGGPQVLNFADLLHAYLRVSHRRRPVVPVWMPGIRAVRAGALLVPPAGRGQYRPADLGRIPG